MKNKGKLAKGSTFGSKQKANYSDKKMTLELVVGIEEAKSTSPKKNQRKEKNPGVMSLNERKISM